MNMPGGIVNRLAAALLTCLIATSAVAQSDQQTAEEESAAQKTKQAQAVSKEVYDRITAAQEAIEAEDFSSAMSILNSLLGKKGLTEYEQQNVLNYIGFVQYSTDDTKGAIATYKKMLQIPSIEPQIKKQTVYTLAQLSTMEEDFSGALKLMDEWFVLEPNPPPEAYILYAQNLYQLNRYKDMIKPIETAMSVATARDLEVKEDWYVLLNFAYFQQENYAKVRDIQKILLVKWPKKRYWFSLAGAYTELGEEKNLVNAYAAAYTQGLLEKESELVTMAQLFMQAEVPYKAGKLLEEEMKKGRVAKDAKNYRILSQAWSLAMEDEKAIPALKEAARLSDEGELDLRLGNAYLNVGQYSDCVTSIQAGMRKGGIKSMDNAQISLGMCQYNLKKYQDAINSFRDAAKSSRSSRVANQWISVIQSDIERNEQIRLAEAAARKQQEALSKRRATAERL
jgi:tetratricopeptide (TPR) repeat protein